jgi:hypothetical protein
MSDGGPVDPNAQQDPTTFIKNYIAQNGGIGALTSSGSGGSAGTVYLGAAPSNGWHPMGPGEPHVSEATESGHSADGHLSGNVDLNTAKLSIRAWTPEAQYAFAQSVYKMGLVKDPANWLAVVNVWEQAVNEAANWYAAGKKDVTPESILPLLATGAKQAAGPQTSVATTKPSQGDARAIIQNIFQQGVGRDPSKAEIAKFAKMIDSYAAKHPSVSTTTQTGDGSTTDTQQAAQQTDYSYVVGDQVKATPEYGAYQAATTYYNALQDLLHNG